MPVCIQTYGCEWVKCEASKGLLRECEIIGNLRLNLYCEVNTNWLPPLLAPIAEDGRTVAVPLVDRIDYLSFQYEAVYSEQVAHAQ